jgi:hypothetical protein
MGMMDMHARREYRRVMRDRRLWASQGLCYTLPNLSLDTEGDGVEDYEKSRRMYGGIMARENPVEFRVDD